MRPSWKFRKIYYTICVVKLCLSVCVSVCLHRCRGCFDVVPRPDGVDEGAEICTACWRHHEDVHCRAWRPGGGWVARGTRWKTVNFPIGSTWENVRSKRAKTSKCDRHRCVSELISRELSVGSTRGHHWRVENWQGSRIGCQSGCGPVHVHS